VIEIQLARGGKKGKGRERKVAKDGTSNRERGQEDVGGASLKRRLLRED